ncbi:MAG: fatty acid--CoA ligase family protein [Gammaproteobacteria bacterium]
MPAVTSALTTLLQGGTVVLYPPLFDADEYVSAVRDNAITMAFLVPTVLRWLIALPNDGTLLLPTLKILLAAAAPLTPEERQQIVARVSPNLYDMYGSAGGGVITTLLPADMAHHAHTVGKAPGDVELQIVGDDGQLLDADTTGRVRLRGAGVAKAWFSTGDTPTESERVIDGWLYTGDLGSMDAAGYLTLKGRADDVIMRGGVNVYPDIVETALRRCPGVADVAVVGRPVAGADPEIIAFVLPGDPPATESALLAHARNVLPAWMQPAEFCLVDELPRTTSGKVRRRDLLQTRP